MGIDSLILGEEAGQWQSAAGLLDTWAAKKNTLRPLQLT